MNEISPRATPKTKKDLVRLYKQLNAILKELEEISPELSQVTLQDSNGISMKSVTLLFVKNSKAYLKKVSETLKYIK